METVGVIGAGRIGEALLSGLLKVGWSADRLFATDKRPERAAELIDRYGIRFVDSAQVTELTDVLVIAVKPQEAGTLMQELGPRVRPTTVVVSLCAGLPMAFFARYLPEGTPVVRVMTNTPAFVGEAMTAVSGGPHATAEQVEFVARMFRSLGRTVLVPETQQDAVTALSGSGPAYFFHLVDAMIEAGVLLGLPRQIASELVVQTAVGSAVMLRDSGEHPALLREAVTSPAGTTIAALREFENHGVRAAMLDGIEAARNRAQELARSVLD